MCIDPPPPKHTLRSPQAVNPQPSLGLNDFNRPLLPSPISMARPQRKATFADFETPTRPGHQANAQAGPSRFVDAGGPSVNTWLLGAKASVVPAGGEDGMDVDQFGEPEGSIPPECMGCKDLKEERDKMQVERDEKAASLAKVTAEREEAKAAYEARLRKKKGMFTFLESEYTKTRAELDVELVQHKATRKRLEFSDRGCISLARSVKALKERRDELEGEVRVQREAKNIAQAKYDDLKTRLGFLHRLHPDAA
ncbi:hypothetical protein BXZ70DRAFT_677619 [Cristinia sonorae]|uniref:Uncharacterized protein n=1 Tax=Cristinia sonorae TaxID=1940300 RepID=A0A8K0UV94_9AGAR|nr:hypothetical protein BXZ70DRAFT_677619 [Cristinia sonorae]